MRQLSKPVAVIQHTPVGHPGALLPTLDQLNIPWQLISLPNGDVIPSNIDGFSGLITLGGAMSANDDLAWIQAEKALIREAYSKNIPISGHCLGSQIVSKALGASVNKNAQKEIGWLAIESVNKELVQDWFGVVENAVMVFQWHGDTFELPKGAVHVFSSAACKNQAYILNDIHIAMQFHLEMNPEVIDISLAANRGQICIDPDQKNRTVNTEDEIYQGITDYMLPMHKMLFHVYSRWSQNLKSN